jgi:hypothetical protein
MRKIFLSALTTAAILSGGMATQSAEPAIQSAAPVQLATMMCGGNGCVAVQTKHQPKRKFQTLGHG